jgi:hypothetical protein
MQSYPIWNDVRACHYKSAKSYGNKETGEVVVRVGSSRNNSHKLVEHVTTKRTKALDGVNHIVFTFGVDLGPNGHIIPLKRMWFTINRNGNAGELIKEEILIDEKTN